MDTPKGPDLLLHPVRLRIVQALLGGRRLTTAQIGEELPEIANATLYRQVGTLAKAGVLAVVDERRVRGTIERTYALDLDAAELSADALAGMGPEDHRRAFMAFTASLLAQFDRYLDGDVDLLRDGVGYRQTALWLSDAELEQFLARLRDVLQAPAANGPGQGRRRRVLSTVLIPGEPAAGPDRG